MTQFLADICIQRLADILRWLFTTGMFISAYRVFPSALRAFSKSRQKSYTDPIFALIFMFILNRAYYTLRAWYYSNPLDRPHEGSSLIAGYVWGIGLYVALWIVYGWYNGHNETGSGRDS